VGHRRPEIFTGSVAEDAGSSGAGLFLAEHRSVFLSPPPRSGIGASGASGSRGKARRRRKTPGGVDSREWVTAAKAQRVIDELP
jgi:hypothetical protein